MNFQPKFPFTTVEAEKLLEQLDVAIEKKNFSGAPRLTLPQVLPAQVIVKQGYARTSTPQFRTIIQHTPFPQTPDTPIVIEALKTPVEAKKCHTDPQVPFPTPSLDFSRSLRAGITYIPPTMMRHKELTMVDALIACSMLILFGFIVMMLLYYFSI